MASTGSELYTAGQLSEAVTAMSEEVKGHPTDQTRRGFLAELLCIAGDLERADKQLDVLANQDPQAALGVAMFRQLVRAEQARQQFYTEGRLPEFLTEPDEQLRTRLEASVLIREGQHQEAAQLLKQAEERRPPVTGSCNGAAFDDLRDMDDLTASFFEVLTSNGKYYWIPMSSVVSVEFRPPERPRDVLWRRAGVSMRDGPDGEVFFPATYADAGDAATDQMRLGRATDWTGGEDVPVRGLGQRTFLVGAAGCTIMELETIEISGPS